MELFKLVSKSKVLHSLFRKGHNWTIENDKNLHADTNELMD
ncbi:MAG: hypothetical protein WCF60_10845 [Anaerobacillus sp.]